MTEPETTNLGVCPQCGLPMFRNKDVYDIVDGQLVLTAYMVYCRKMHKWVVSVGRELGVDKCVR